MMMNSMKQPEWCCDTCGKTYGRWYASGYYTGPEPAISTYHIGTCDVCEQKEVAVTEPRDFGYLTPGWKKDTRYARGRV